MNALARLFAGVFAASVMAVAPAAAVPTLSPETFTLGNGLVVVVVPDHRAPVATHMVWYRVGAADEPPGQSGIAHFLEHLMFRGTEKVPSGEFSKIVAKNGGQDNAYTSRDFTAYFQSVAVDRLPLVMELEADRMRGLKLTPDIVETERKVILEERSTRTDNDPSSLLYEQTQASLYMSHPYGIPVIGWAQEIRDLTHRDVVAFYDRFYAPNNAIVVVAGDVTGAQVRMLAEKYYGPLAANPGLALRKRPPVPPQLAARRVVLTDARAELPSLTRYYLVPSYARAAKGEAEALEVLAQLLGGGPTSWLYRSLVVDQKLAASAGAGYMGEAYDDTSFMIYATPRPGVTTEALEEALDRALATFLRDMPAKDDLARAKAGLVAAAVYARDSQHAMARSFGEALTTGKTVADVIAWPKRIEAVRAREVHDVARRYLIPARSVTGILKPEGKAPPRAATVPAAPPVSESVH